VPEKSHVATELAGYIVAHYVSRRRCFGREIT